MCLGKRCLAGGAKSTAQGGFVVLNCSRMKHRVSDLSAPCQALGGGDPPRGERQNRKCDPHHIRTLVRFAPD